MRTLTLTALCLLLAAPVAANPIMMESNHGLQVPKSMHVQISYLCETDDPEPGWCAIPKGVSRDDEIIAETFQGPTGVSINGGSGIATYYAWQFCDCDVEPGTYQYKLLFEGETWLGGEMAITVTDPPPEPRSAEPMPEGEISPWDIPESPWPKGLDCVAFCEDGPVEPGEDTAPTGDDVVIAGEDTVSAPVDTVQTEPDTLGSIDDPAPVTPEVVDDEPLSCGVGAGVAVPGILIMLALLALLYRRRAA